MLFVIAFGVALVLSLALTPLGTRAAWAVGYLDHPEARKLHTSATALLGGAVVFISALIALLIAHPARTIADRQPIYLVAGAIIALGLGLWDDRFGMNPVIKLVGQAAAAGTFLASGAVPNLGLPLPLTYLLTMTP
jgi:UDP-GlcNAc:undecaprenyl-phosphate GlcNAc-1-phosphate transferase